MLETTGIPVLTKREAVRLAYRIMFADSNCMTPASKRWGFIQSR